MELLCLELLCLLVYFPYISLWAFEDRCGLLKIKKKYIITISHMVYHLTLMIVSILHIMIVGEAFLAIVIVAQKSIIKTMNSKRFMGHGALG